MTAYKCDICGGFFSKQKVNIINSKLKFSRYVRLGDKNNFADICPKCTDALQEVIENRININDTEV